MRHTIWIPRCIVIAALSLALSCSGGGDGDTTLPPVTGGLTVSITGLPAGAVGGASIAGPGGFSQTVSATTTLTSLATGSYTVTATPATIATVTYDPTPASQTVAVTAGATATASIAYAPSVVGRALADRPDAVTGSQIHVIYAVPSDGVDRQRDTNGALLVTVTVWQNWLSTQTGGRRLRLDTFPGGLDITFARLTRSDATMQSYGVFVRDTIEKDLRTLGLVAANKIYAVYYDGGSATACGGGAWPPQLPGVVGALYLQGTPPGSIPCNANPLASSPTATPGYLEYAMLHELLHTLGIVSPGAPNHVLQGHVGTGPTDLMYAGSLPWTPTTLDVNRQNYYNPAGLAAGVYNLATSPFLAP